MCFNRTVLCNTDSKVQTVNIPMSQPAVQCLHPPNINWSNHSEALLWPRLLIEYQVHCSSIIKENKNKRLNENYSPEISMFFMVSVYTIIGRSSMDAKFSSVVSCLSQCEGRIPRKLSSLLAILTQTDRFQKTSAIRMPDLYPIRSHPQHRPSNLSLFWQ